MLAIAAPPRRLIAAVLLILSGSAFQAEAHNGAVAIAVPVVGITVDGDLSDWPQDMRRYPIAVIGEGPAPQGSADLQADFRVGYNDSEDALYVAVEVEDDCIALEHPNSSQRDGCELFLDLYHSDREDLEVLQAVIWGNETRVFRDGEPADSLASRAVTAAVHRSARAHHYEWRIALGGKGDRPAGTRHGASIGFEVAVSDLDREDVPSYVTWGRGMPKHRDGVAANRGDLLLLDAQQQVGWVRGRRRSGS